jgi:hypothetical protein
MIVKATFMNTLRIVHPSPGPEFAAEMLDSSRLFSNEWTGSLRCGKQADSSNCEMTAVALSLISRSTFRRMSLLLVSSGLHAQAQVRFEVATICLNPDCSGETREQQSPGRFGLLCVSLRDVIRTAYGNVEGPSPGRLLEVLGGPRWIDSDRYDIVATAPDNPGLDQMYGPMTRTLLEDRFRLKLHDETRNLPVYELTVLKQVPKLKPTPDGSCVPVDL